jgi:hypothetical protein
LQESDVLSQVSASDLAEDNGYTESVIAYVREEYSWVFLLENSFFALVIDPPPYIINERVVRELPMQWFTYHRNKCGLIVINAVANISDVLELVDETSADFIIFNIDLF